MCVCCSYFFSEAELVKLIMIWVMQEKSVFSKKTGAHMNEGVGAVFADAADLSST